MRAWSYPHVCILHTVAYRRTVDSIRLLAVPDCATVRQTDRQTSGGKRL